MFTQELFAVFGGELMNVQGTTFKDPSKIDVVGIFADAQQAKDAWKAKAQQTVDNAHMRYFIIPLDMKSPQWEKLGYMSEQDMIEHQKKFIG